ncbi:MAG: multidrug efflux RND transporter permease subunit [Pseudomonadota bacterium]
MRFSHFFVDRPIFASVLSILIMLVGGLAYFGLPVTQYPDIAPPTVVVNAAYPGASAEVVANTVATPLEQELNGVEGLLYMLSQSTSDGIMTLTLTFELGTDLDQAQVLVQNRVAIAEPRLPESVRRLGVTTQKNSPDLLMVVNLFSPDDTYDQIFIANYAVLQLRDPLRRLRGVGQIQLFGASEYAMRIWLDPDRIAAYGLTAGEVVAALRAQNVQVASGVMNQPPQSGDAAFQINVQTQGRLSEPDEFAEVVVKADDDGRVIRVRDVGRVELGAQSYTTRGYLGSKPAIAMPVSQRPGSNALDTAREVEALMEELSADFPPGLEYAIAYNPTEFIGESVDAVTHTIFEAVALVIIVVVLFLQSWRSAVIPIVAIPISLIGTFAVMASFGFSLNNLSLFGLVLAIGIVVDDAIVVVENVERNLAEGMSPKEAAHHTMDEVGGALIAISLVLVAVFVPTAFIAGISGQFYRQFALTIATATAISAFVSLTLSPALAGVLLRPHGAHLGRKRSLPGRLVDGFFSLFNRGMDGFSNAYGAAVSRLVRVGALMALVYLGLLGLTALQFQSVPSGFIPAQDQRYLVVAIQLPAGSKLDRTDAVVREATEKLLEIEGITETVGFAGFDGATFTQAPNAAAIFPVMASFEETEAMGITFEALVAETRQRMAEIEEAFVLVIPPPPVRGVGTGGGFKMYVQDRTGRGLETLAAASQELVASGNQEPGLVAVFSLFSLNTPQLFLDIDRVRAQSLAVPINRVFETLEVYFGSAFINDFNFLGRTFQVTAQADAPYRRSADDLLRLRTRNRFGEVVPIGSVATVEAQTGPYRVARYNLYPAVAVQGDTLPGTSSGEALSRMERLADAALPRGLSYQWTELAYQQKTAGNTAGLVFALSVLFVFLLLAAQYESWLLPLSIILIVPMVLLSAISGIALMGLPNDILVQIGLVVLVGLACKNAILIVEFAKQQEDSGLDRFEAAVQAARLRLRPILMTSLAFILGVVPLMIASGAGAEMRRALGTTVFSGMLGVTFFGLLFTPVFYVLCRKLARTPREAPPPSTPPAVPERPAEPVDDHRAGAGPVGDDTPSTRGEARGASS